MQRFGGRQGRGRLCAVLAVALREQGENSDAVRHLDRFLEIAKESDDMPAQAEACCTLGTTHNALGNFSDAVDHFQRYYDLARSILANLPSAENQKNVEGSKVYLGLARANMKMDGHLLASQRHRSAV